MRSQQRMVGRANKALMDAANAEAGAMRSLGFWDCQERTVPGLGYTTKTDAHVFEVWRWLTPLEPGPDPSMVYADGYYHLTYTSYDHIEITRAEKISGLLTGEPKTIWTDTNTTRSANMWAPEIHHIDNVWHMFYSSCDADLTCCDSCQPRVLRGCDGPNPYDCEYSFLADLVPPVGFQGGPGKNFSFGIDGTYLEIEGKGRYHVLSAIGPNTTAAIQTIQITELDTTTWSVKGWNIISEPDQAWEMNTTNSSPSSIVAVNEGPHPLYHGGEIWLSYSASYCGTPNYALGLLHYAGGDPLQASSWTKKGPVFSQANGNYGTGHNCFFRSPDGKETWVSRTPLFVDTF
ncbi:hypothetical protein TruAng_002525 [Truncatella angustata]|nr:hypothetical protein TruAng_002525 [Truncatella angustata]